MDSPTKLAESILTALAQNQDGLRAVPMAAYMRNQFQFFGVASPLCKKITKECLRTNTPLVSNQLQSCVSKLWSHTHREAQYCAIFALHQQRKLWIPETLALLEDCVCKKSWWDSVDGLNTHVIRHYIHDFPECEEATVRRWNVSENIWLQRLSIIYQLGRKKDSLRYDILMDNIRHLAASNEFFVQKAIGWMLRECARWDRAFVEHCTTTMNLSRLSVREALKHSR